MEDERDPNQELTEPDTSSTSPPDGKTHEATTPPGNPEPEEGATERAQDKLDQAAGSH